MAYSHSDVYARRYIIWDKFILTCDVAFASSIEPGLLMPDPKIELTITR